MTRPDQRAASARPRQTRLANRAAARRGIPPISPIAAPLLAASFIVAAGTLACGERTPRTDGDPPAGSELDMIAFEAGFVPRWQSPPTQPPVAQPAPEDSVAPTARPSAVVYLDISLPMGGFLPTGAAADAQERTGANQFRTVVQWVPDQLIRAYPGATLAWRAVGQDVTSLPALPRIERSDFAAPASRIDLAMRTALAELRSGRSEAAAIVTDLLGTGENLAPGPLALLPHLRPWLDSEPVRSGDLHLGIIGARADYWGVESRTCPLRDGLGCWYSERGGEWRRMEEVAPAPFYVLLMGRNAAAMATIIESIEADAQGQGIEMVSEILTAASRRRRSSGSCVAFALDDDGQRARQYSLRFRDNNEYSVLRDEPVSLGCRFDDGDPRPTGVRIAGSSDGFSASAADIDADGEFEIDVDPEVLREAETLPDLLIDINAVFADDSTLPAWDDWSIDTDAIPSFPGKTLQLRYFVRDARLKPDHHRTTESMTILRARGS